jgi:hypothetical protein
MAHADVHRHIGTARFDGRGRRCTRGPRSFLAGPCRRGTCGPACMGWAMRSWRSPVAKPTAASSSQCLGRREVIVRDPGQSFRANAVVRSGFGAAGSFWPPGVEPTDECRVLDGPLSEMSPGHCVVRANAGTSRSDGLVRSRCPMIRPEGAKRAAARRVWTPGDAKHAKKITEALSQWQGHVVESEPATPRGQRV